MKKKLFLIAFMLIALVSLLAISVSAQDEADDPYASYYDDVYTAVDGTPLALYEEEGGVYYALAWFYDSTNMTYESFRIGSEVNFCPSGSTTPIKANSDFNGDANVVFVDSEKTYTMADLILVNLQQSVINQFSGQTWKTTSIQAIYNNNSFGFINGNAFANTTTLVVFDIPKTHNKASASICASSFQNCTSLKEIYVPKTVLLMSSAFEGCTALEKVEYASDYAPVGSFGWHNDGRKYGFQFKNCSSLTDVTLPTTGSGFNYMNYIGESMFENCSSLTSIDLPDHCTLISKKAFRNSGIVSIELPAGITLIDEYAFANCTSLETITFAGPAAANTVIGQGAFENATALEGISIPEGVTTLNNCAFKGCSSLNYLSLPTTLTTLGGGQHFLNTALTTVEGLENTQLTSISFDMFRGLKNWKPEVLKLPNTVETISGQALADVGMKTLILSANLTSITSNALTNCKSLEVIYVPAGAPILGTSYGLYDCNSSALKLIFFEGADATAIQSYENYTPITYAEYVESPEIYATGNYIVTSTNTCFAFYDNEHDIPVDVNNKCCGICERCSEKQFFDDPVHTGEWSFDGTYVTGYLASYDCIYCETNITNEDIEALFISKGYSCTVFEGAISIVQGFDINREAIARYEELTGKEVSYGVVATSVNKVIDGNIDVVNNVDGITAIDFTSAEKKEFTRFEIKVADIAEANQDTGLYACAYVIEDGAVSFISENACTAQAVAKTAAAILQENPV